jgi:hypothetical protein
MTTDINHIKNTFAIYFGRGITWKKNDISIFCSGHIFTFSFRIPLLASIPPNHYSLGVLASIIFCTQ